MAITLNKKQSETIQSILHWYYFETRKKLVYALAGYAGTGKTFISKYVIKALGLMDYQILFVTPTGKAAFVAKMRGVEAKTIRKTFYTTFKRDKKLGFSKKNTFFSTIRFIIIDEASMVDDGVMRDIISFKIPILLLFDRGQLPPIYGSNSYIKKPDAILTEIMRQSNLSGILILATMAREGKPISIGTYQESNVVWLHEIENIESYDIILCWKNSTKDVLNRIVRNNLGYNSTLPQKGEKLVCLKTNYLHHLQYTENVSIDLVNGIDLIALSDAKPIVGRNYFLIDYKPSFIKETDDYFFETKVALDIFKNPKMPLEEFDETSVAPDTVLLDYGYAYTVHKSQGSEWERVLVIDEFVGSQEMYNRWLYTAITRAKKEVTIAKIFK